MEKFINDEEFDKALEEAEKAVAQGLYSTIIKFKQPREWEGRTFDSLTFNWDRLTGEDFLNIEQDMAMQQKALVVADFNTDFIMGMALRCCEEMIDAKFLRKLPIAVFNRIRNGGRSFLLMARA